MSTQSPASGVPVAASRHSGPVVFIGAGLILIALLALWYGYQVGNERTEDAYVDGNAVQVTSQITGTVTGIGADNTDYVCAGDPVVRLNPVDAEIQFERSKAALARATRMARTQYSQVEQLQAEVDQRSNDVGKARADVQRRAQLASSGAVSREEISHAEDILKNAVAGLASTRQPLAQRRAMVDGTTLRSHPDVLTAAANLRDAFVARDRTVVLAPVTGVVTRRSVQVGQRISPGVALMTVVPLDHLWVNANFKESQLEHIRIGQPVTLTADSYGTDVVFHGTVAGLDAGSGSAFALLPAQNATGNWIKVTQRVPVKIALDPQEIARNPLRLGISMRVKVDTRAQDGDVLRADVPREDLYSTAVFDNELKNADALVESVITENEGAQRAPALSSARR
ncbi:HlyD family efflux transporter periplasmic adaptor subunit [Pseudomonas sp. W2Oct36]|uniref:HlyD family secretion protein n=1 Tax=Pseudomonas sp. W2Oct36 TaxID=1215284 RepID=UPI0034E06CAF